MANNKMYENYLMHYRTKGALNGETKYPGKYTPIGKKAREDYVAPLGNTRNRINSMTSEDFSKIRRAEDRTGHIDSTNVGSAYRNYKFRNDTYGTGLGKISNLLNDVTKPVSTVSLQQREAEAARRANQHAAEQRRIAGGNSGMARSINAKPLLSVAQAVGMRGIGAYNDKKKYEETRMATQRAAEARRIAGGDPYVNQREENRKAAEQRRIAGGSGISASQRQKEAEARRIAGGSQGTITTAEAKRKNINDWYGNQVRGGNQSAAEARRIKGGTQGATKNAESEKKKKKLKNVLKSLIKSRSKGISRLF